MSWIFTDTLNTYIPIVLLVAFIAIVKVISRGKSAEIKTKTSQLKSLYKNSQVFLCYSAEDMGKNLIQLWGEPFGTSIRPGMKIIGPDGVEYTIKEVYADDNTPEKPDPIVSAGTAGTPIVIETANWNWESYKQGIRRDKVLALKLRT